MVFPPPAGLPDIRFGVRGSEVAEDGKSVRLTLPDLAPTWGMEIRYRMKGADGRAVAGVVHNTIHAMGR